MSPKIDIGEPNSKNVGCCCNIALHLRINNLISVSVNGTYVFDFLLNKNIIIYIFCLPFNR
jgi:hypothetical protein